MPIVHTNFGTPGLIATGNAEFQGVSDADLEEMVNPSNPQLRELANRRDEAAAELELRRRAVREHQAERESGARRSAMDPGRVLSEKELNGVGEAEFQALRRAFNNLNGVPWKALRVFSEITEHLIRTNRFRAAVRLLRDNGFLSEFKSRTIEGGVGQTMDDVSAWFEGGNAPKPVEKVVAPKRKTFLEMFSRP